MSDETMLRGYLADVERTHASGRATEHSYRPALQTLLQSLVPGVTATNEPKRAQYGAPDYVISRGSNHGPLTVGYVETKDIGLSLNEVERSEQLKRYKGALHSLVLTDYLEFRWFVNGETRLSGRIASLRGGKIVPDAAGFETIAQLLRAFLGRGPELISSPKELARRMAQLAHIIRDITVETMTRDAASDELKGLHEAFKEVLIPELTAPEFADMFAQTLAYGLFAARNNHSGPAGSFSRRDAAREIPKTNPFLRKLFNTITGSALDDEPFIGFVDDLAQMLGQTDMDAVLKDFGTRTKQEDPIVHFYETFLAAYDPKLRELRGVYYTPEPVVSYITRSVDALLKRDFGLREGLADRSTTTYERKDEHGQMRTETAPRVLLLDPACGTGTFLYKVIDLIRERFQAAGNSGMWSGYVREHLLPRLFGFELLMAPYAMAHLKLGMQLAGMDLPEAQRKEWAYDFAGDERLGVYLTNTLDEAAKRSERLKLGGYISDEANEAAHVKRDYPVMVVLGNPPYSGHSANKGAWINALLRGKDTLTGAETGNYFAVDGKPLGERNPKWLNDDYVKFIRFAQWRIERTGHGILAFISNHGYLDNPTFRGMRQSLMRSFDEIYVLDLHGNSKKKERTPEGGPDENVFDIQQGVAIGIFVRRPGTAGATRQATVRHAHLWGERAGKYAWLAERDAVRDTDWTPLDPQAPFYFFKPREANLEVEYGRGWKLTEVMPVNVLGFQTHRDHFAIDIDAGALRRRIEEMRDEHMRDADFAAKYELSDNRDWQLSGARRLLRTDADWQTRFVRCLYRPFDARPCYFGEVAMDYPRTELRQHMLVPNMSLNVTRQTRAEEWRNAVVADAPTPALYTEIKDGSNAFPLYLYPGASKAGLWGEERPSTAPGGRQPNLAPEFIADLTHRLEMEWIADGRGDRQQTVGPEDVFYYAYAIFYSPGYRERYADFLKEDFPRIPLTSDKELFRELCGLGERLVRLHLMEGESGEERPRYPVKGDDAVEKVRYTAPGEGGSEQGRVWINTTQYFEGVAPEVWEFHIGGYQVCEKWLKDRKGRTLSYDNLTHYAGIVAALAETRAIMDEIDEVIEEHGGWPLT
jgi:hypothetical protein